MRSIKPLELAQRVFDSNIRDSQFHDAVYELSTEIWLHRAREGIDPEFYDEAARGFIETLAQQIADTRRR